MSGKRYPEEFKIEAVKQVIDRGHSVSSVVTVFSARLAGFALSHADRRKCLSALRLIRVKEVERERNRWLNND